MTLKVVKDQNYDLKYYTKLQGFVYNLLKNTFYNDLHSKTDYKYFCFSNIFPPPKSLTDSFREGDTKHLLISSPNSSLLSIMKQKLTIGRMMHIGDMSFQIENISSLRPKINKNKIILDTKTPILVRYLKNNRLVYWNPRKKDNFQVFLKQLDENLYKKYEHYYGVEMVKEPFFGGFEFKGSVVVHPFFSGKEVKVFGTLWNFHFENLTREQTKILKFGIDTGFGERNTYGFGFMDVKQR